MRKTSVGISLGAVLSLALPLAAENAKDRPSCLKNSHRPTQLETVVNVNTLRPKTTLPGRQAKAPVAALRDEATFEVEVAPTGANAFQVELMDRHIEIALDPAGQHSLIVRDREGKPVSLQGVRGTLTIGRVNDDEESSERLIFAAGEGSQKLAIAGKPVTGTAKIRLELTLGRRASCVVDLKFNEADTVRQAKLDDPE